MAACILASNARLDTWSQKYDRCPKARRVVANASPKGATKTVAQRVKLKRDDDFAATPERRYINFTGFLFPLGPLLTRKTVRKEIVQGQMWSFEQPQGLAFTEVQVNTRMTLTQLSDGSFLVYNPIAPTQECLKLISELNAEIKYIVLGSAAYEHKVFVGPFSRRFPKAKVYVAPGQWSFPLNLPVQFFGIFPTATLQPGDNDFPWVDEFDMKVFQAPRFASVGLYSEVALFHRASRTLLVTDAVIQLPRKPPECLSPETLLANAKNGFVIRTADQVYGQTDISDRKYAGQPVPDTPQNRLTGWQRICLLVSFFGPSELYDPQASFDKYAGRPIVFPVVGSLVYSRCGEAVKEWIEEIARDWDFKQVVPAHFAAPVPCTGRDLISAFQRSTDVYEPFAPENAASPETAGNAAKVSSDTGLGRPGGFLQRLLRSRLAGSQPGETVLDSADLKALEALNRWLEALKAVDVRPRGPMIRGNLWSNRD